MRQSFHPLATLALLLWTPTRALDAGPPEPTSWEAVDGILGRSGKVLPGGVRKYGWPRGDLRVTVAGVTVEPTLALGSWAAFVETAASQTMAMGDLVLVSEEVNPVVRGLQAGGIDVLAIHNHLIGESPQLIYVHFGGHGDAAQLARTLRAALDATKTPLGPPQAAPAPSPAEAAVLEGVQAALGRKGSYAGRVLQVGVPRTAKIEEDGAEVPAGAGMATALNFQAVGGRAATTGDFVLVADEVNPVIRELGAHGFLVTALHSHMLHETPRLFFLHFWGLDDPERVGGALKAALGHAAVQ